MFTSQNRIKDSDTVIIEINVINTFTETISRSRAIIRRKS